MTGTRIHTPTCNIIIGTSYVGSSVRQQSAVVRTACSGARRPRLSRSNFLAAGPRQSRFSARCLGLYIYKMGTATACISGGSCENQNTCEVCLANALASTKSMLGIFCSQSFRISYCGVVELLMCGCFP